MSGLLSSKFPIHPPVAKSDWIKRIGGWEGTLEGGFVELLQGGGKQTHYSLFPGLAGNYCERKRIHYNDIEA